MPVALAQIAAAQHAHGKILKALFDGAQEHGSALQSLSEEVREAVRRARKAAEDLDEHKADERAHGSLPERVKKLEAAVAQLVAALEKEQRARIDAAAAEGDRDAATLVAIVENDNERKALVRGRLQVAAAAAAPMFLGIVKLVELVAALIHM